MVPVQSGIEPDRSCRRRAHAGWATHCQERTSRTGGPMPLSSPAGMSGAVYRAWCTRGGHAPARRLWCAQKTPRICLLRSGVQRTRGLPASPRLRQAAVLNPRI